jgi:pimeloyl-ACP methyl ester carboxylesterase
MRVFAATLCLSVSILCHGASIEGHWVGSIEKDGHSLPIELDVAKSGKELRASITFPYCNWLDSEARAVEFRRGNVHVEIGRERVFVFDGTLKKDTIDGTFTADDFNAMWHVERGKLERPYTQEEVTFKNGDITLAGVLVTPKSAGPHPAIVMLHGSGDNFRAWYTYPADYFARLGFSVLYFDKRGNGKSTGDWHDVGFESLAEDGIAGVHFLQSRPEIDKKRVGMWGISQAGWIMTYAAWKSPDVAFVISISGGSIPVEREGYWDFEWKLRTAGFSEEDVSKAVNLLKMDNAVTRTRQGHAELIAAVKTSSSEPWFKKMGWLADGVNGDSRNHYARILDFNPQTYLPEVNAPILWLDGDNDESWPTTEAHGYLKKVKAERNKDWTLHVFSSATHGIWNEKKEAPWPFYTKPQSFWNIQNEWLREKAFGK